LKVLRTPARARPLSPQIEGPIPLFEKWGFFWVGKLDVDDYGKFHFNITQEMVDGWVEMHFTWESFLRAAWEENPGTPFDPGKAPGCPWRLNSSQGDSMESRSSAPIVG
jgi:hypothetical protein